MANPNLKIQYTKLFINNEWVDAVSGKTFPTFNPATGTKITDIAEGDKADVDKAVEAAKKAFARGSEWRNMDASARGRLLYKLADLCERDADILANLDTIDNGKRFADAQGDVTHSIAVLRYFAGWADKTGGRTVPVDGPYFTVTRKEPIGIIGQITPWNFPFMMVSWKWGPALATGNVIVFKPAEQTPLSALYAAALAKEAGFPAGVINVVPGYGPTAGAAISEHQEIRKVAFTGSTEVGKIISAAAAKSNLKKVSLELGGKSPLVIFDDVDLDEAVQIAAFATFANCGQCCCAGTRTFVHENIYDEFVKRATKYAKENFNVGQQYDAKTVLGPQIDEEMMTKTLNYIEAGRKEGAKLETGGKRVGKNGYFVEPTVFSNVTDNMSIATDEIFGPVQSILKFKTLEEAIERANSTTYGLAAGILTKDINKALVFSQAAEAGTIWVNTFLDVIYQAPFGGYKQSGIGRELGQEALELYLETKTVTIRVPTKN